jgi:hypothetical protein
MMPSTLGAAAVLAGSVLITALGVEKHRMFLEVLPEFVAGAILAQHLERIVAGINQLSKLAISVFAVLT